MPVDDILQGSAVTLNQKLILFGAVQEDPVQDHDQRKRQKRHQRMNLVRVLHTDVTEVFVQVAACDDTA